MLTIAISFKMYFSRKETIQFCKEVARGLPQTFSQSEAVRVAVLPDYLSLGECARILLPVGVQIGSQDICNYDRGAFTGEISGSDLAELGVSIAEIGHMERRRRYHESDQMIAQKVTAAWRNNLIPLLCVGEDSCQDPFDAANICIKQIDNAILGDANSPLWIAYEPHWAIGADRPADDAYVSQVCAAIKQRISSHRQACVIYGGSAGLGQLSRLRPYTDGLFLGRFAHDPDVFVSIVEEAMKIWNIERTSYSALLQKEQE